jgi:hypothetical protein
VDARTTIAPPAMPIMSGLARWTPAVLPSTGPFPLYFDEHQPNYRCHVDPGENPGNSPASMRVAMANALPVVRPWRECVIRFEPPRPDKPLKQFLLLPPGAVSKTSARRARAEAILKAAYRAAAPRVETKPIWQPPANEPVDFVTQFDMLMDDEISDKISVALLRRAYSVDELATERRWQGRYSSVKLDALAHPGTETREERHKFALWPFFTEPVAENKYDLKVRQLTLQETESGFAIITTLAETVSKNKNIEISRIAKAKPASAQACQLAEFILRFDLFGKRDRAIPSAVLLAARVVYQTVLFELLLRDYEIRIEQLSRGRRKQGPSRLEVVTFMLQPGVSSTDAKMKFDRNDSDLRKLRTEELELIEAKFGRFCKVLVIPPRTKVRPGYNESIGSREIVELQLSPAERAERIADYLNKTTRPALSLPDFNYICWLRIMHRFSAGSLIARYLERGAGIYRTYQCVADYLLQHEDVRILTTQAIHYGTAPLGKDGRSNRTVLEEYLGGPARERPEWTPNADTEYGADVGLRRGLVKASDVSSTDADTGSISRTRKNPLFSE